MSATADRIIVSLQRLLPARLLGRLVYAISRWEFKPFKNLLIRGFIRFYRIDTAELASVAPDDYPSFNAFFTRRLKDGARPLADEAAAVASPADGTVVACGAITGEELIQAKGLSYTLAQLFDGDTIRARELGNGAFLTVYLAPYNYHCVHMPMDGVLREMRYVPGRLLSVNARTTGLVPGLYTSNERLVCHFEGRAGGFSVVLVGAFNVGSMTTAWAGELAPRRLPADASWSYAGGDEEIRLARGEYMGQFNLGSTVILITGPDQVEWHGLAAGNAIRMGQTVGHLAGAADSA